MPITKRFEASQYLEDFEELDEYSPLFPFIDYSHILEEDENIVEEKINSNISFWKRCWDFLRLKFST